MHYNQNFDGCRIYSSYAGEVSFDFIVMNGVVLNFGATRNVTGFDAQYDKWLLKGKRSLKRRNVQIGRNVLSSFP